MIFGQWKLQPKNKRPPPGPVKSSIIPLRTSSITPRGLLLVAAAALAQPCVGTTVPKLTPAVAATNGLVPLRIEYPRPGFMSAGNLIRIPPGMVWDKSTERAPKPFYAPRGTTNVALHKPVTASDKRTNLGEVTQITDGQKQGYDGDVVELPDGRQWVQIDLKANYHIYGIMVWHSPVDRRIYRDVVAQVSNDPQLKQGVTTVYNNDQYNETGHGRGKDLPYVESSIGKLIDAKGPRKQGLVARYVRLL